MDRKQLRKAMSPAGWSMLIYYLIITVCTTAVMLVEMLMEVFRSLAYGDSFSLDAAMAAEQGAWGYFLAVAIGIVILLFWKKPKFWREQIWAKGKPMKTGAFFGILAVFLSAQCIYQVTVIVLELVLNSFGLTVMEGLQAVSAGSGNFSMFLYVGVLAPVTEELLCRGLVQRMLMPYGKRLAILGSAFLFGIFHGNILQAPYAFIVGLVLGYVAAEYSIAWAMLLHMINNLVVGDMIARLSVYIGDIGSALLVWSILLPCAIGAVITLVRRRREIGTWLRRNPLRPGYAACFFGSAGVVTLTVLMALSMIGTCFFLITPL